MVEHAYLSVRPPNSSEHTQHQDLHSSSVSAPSTGTQKLFHLWEAWNGAPPNSSELKSDFFLFQEGEWLFKMGLVSDKTPKVLEIMRNPLQKSNHLHKTMLEPCCTSSS